MAKKEIKRHPAANAIADLILQNYEINNAKDIHEAIKDAFGPLFEKMLDAEMDAHLGYSKSSPEIKDTDNRRNGYTEKTIRTSMGQTTIKTPRDRNGSFEPGLFLNELKMLLMLKIKY